MAEQPELVAKALALRDSAERFRELLERATREEKPETGMASTGIPYYAGTAEIWMDREAEITLTLSPSVWGDRGHGGSTFAARGSDSIESVVFREALREAGWVIAARMADKLDKLSEDALRAAEGQALEVIAALNKIDAPPF